MEQTDLPCIGLCLHSTIVMSSSLGWNPLTMPTSFRCRKMTLSFPQVVPFQHVLMPEFARMRGAKCFHLAPATVRQDFVSRTNE